MVQSENTEKRKEAVDQLKTNFVLLPNSGQAWEDLHRLTQDDDSNVRRHAASALGSAFNSIPDSSKDDAWEDLHRLTQDIKPQVRVSTNYSLGRVSILKATEAVNENEFKNEMKNALQFFEKSNAEATFINPAKFCHPFYKSIFLITFEERNAEAEVQEYIKKAKNAVEGSESKKTLLDAIENLENALKEVHKSREKGLYAWKSDLKAYRRYCDRACDLLDSTKENAPGATKIIRKGLPLIDQRIKEIITEIQENAETLCKQTRDTPFEDLGKEVYRIGESLVKTKDPIRLEKKLDDFQFILSAICDKMPEEEKKELNRQLGKMNNEAYIEDRFDSINIIISKISSQINKEKISNIYNLDADQISFTNINNSKINKQNSGIKNLTNTETKKKQSFIDKINSPATIAAFIGFIASEILVIYPSGYNIHVVSVIIAAIIFVIVFVISKKDYI